MRGVEVEEEERGPSVPFPMRNLSSVHRDGCGFSRWHYGGRCVVMIECFRRLL